MTIPTTRLPTEAEIADINARHLIETPLRPADLLFVFGTRQDVEERVDEACRLWRAGYFRWAIVSGGVTPGSKLSECEIIAGAMIARGVPAGVILREDRATNTGENVIFSLPIIERALGLANIRSVICLGNTWTARRYPMTLHRHWPEVEKMLVTVDSFATPRALWHTDAEFSRRMLREWDKIEPYKARGFIAEWPDSGLGLGQQAPR
ncbi:YdcF family protein [Bradyrhizobium sp. BWA-3-5]|uniref:YdcF family protein n=1 Tax=Bradyrhizobium sp. BWA-3-5 TaxID=3080013 RepID=UPI00293E05F8|nr:YdcF family protein [Bradyrhizobium sp. BWA-3-5]WOH64424.1 YdcF family protein [Bradyrhizobium sp. BWA-3-5]